MTRLSLLDKLMILFNMIKSSNMNLIILGIIIVIFIVLAIVTHKNKKIGKTVYILGMISVLGYLVTTYHPNLLKMFEYMMDNFFIALYFPTLAIYFAAIIIMNIIIWKTVFSNKTSKIIKITNTIVYLIMNYLLILIMNVITKDKLDVFDQSSVYQNDNARALIELSSILFILWIIFLIIYKVIYEYLIKDLPKRKKSYKVVESPSIAYKENDIKEYVIAEDKINVKTEVKEKNYQFVDTPEFIKGQTVKKNVQFVSAPTEVQSTKKQITIPVPRKKTLWNKFVDFMLMREEKPIAMKIVSPKESIQRSYQITSTPDRIMGQKKKEKIVQNTELPSMIKGKKKSTLNDQSFTLEDYKLFSQILKNQKENQVEEPKVEKKVIVEEPVEVLEVIDTENKYQARDNDRREKIFGSMNDIDKYREEQKKEILEAEKERRKLLNRQMNKQRKIDLKEEQEILERRRQNEEQREQNKMTELERLYQGINF